MVYHSKMIYNLRYHAIANIYWMKSDESQKANISLHCKSNRNRNFLMLYSIKPTWKYIAQNRFICKLTDNEVTYKDG